MNVIYLVSEQFRYENTIHADSGPGYARRHRWMVAEISKLRDVVRDHVTLIDNRVTPDEIPAIERSITAFPRSPFYIKVVDPYWECVQQPYYRWLLKLTRHRNVRFVGPYQAVGFISILTDMAGADAYIQLPYAYEANRELPLAEETKRKFLIVSGATHPDFYPERVAIIRSVRRHRWIARGVNILGHPGYPDIGQSPQHKVTGDAYVQFLSQYTFMYLEPSREGLEFLKYTECAYAGCVPVGRAPATFPSELKKIVIAWESADLKSGLRAIRSIPTTTAIDIARRYRYELKGIRDPEALNQRLIDRCRYDRESLAGGP